jgi:type IV pilus assembly protein PilQ
MASALLAPWMVQATGISVQAQSTPARGGAERPQAQPKATAVAQGQLNLQLRRQPGMLQVVVEGAGSAPELQQSASGNAWQGLLVTNGNPGLRQGLQQFSAPEAGIESISLSGSGNRYQIDVRGLARMALPRPQVSADGLNLIVSFPTTGQATSSTANFDLNRPGRLPQPSFAPPLQPRAVAPPVGDMAVGTMMLANTSFVRLSGPKITMTLRNAPAKDV